jgi:hypothetical protein
MRAREDRIIRARLKFYDRRSFELQAHGMLTADASKQAYDEARKLRFNRKGEVVEDDSPAVTRSRVAHEAMAERIEAQAIKARS